MLEDIYPRLLSELAVRELGLSELDIRRIIDEHNSRQHANASYGRLIKSVYQADPDSDIGLRLGSFLLPSKLCDLSRVLITAENLLEALSLSQRIYYVQGACYHPFISHVRNKVYISLIFPYRNNPSEAQKRFCSETAFSYIINGIRETIAPGFTPNRVLFDYPEPSYARKYPPLMGNNLGFNQHLTMIEFDDHYLFKKHKAYNPVLHHMYLNKYLDFARESERLSSFEYKAISYLLLHHPDTMNSKKLASKLNISVRGLQKRLSKTGQSFSSIANHCRRELAKVYLVQEQQNLDYTAEQLGFQTSSGFRRFFKTEFDTTPSEYIEHAKGMAESRR